MRYGVTYNQDGQVIPAGLHIPSNFARLPYVPHPLQIMGMMNMFPVMGQQQATAGQGTAVAKLGQQTGGGRH